MCNNHETIIIVTKPMDGNGRYWENIWNFSRYNNNFFQENIACFRIENGNINIEWQYDKINNYDLIILKGEGNWNLISKCLEIYNDIRKKGGEVYFLFHRPRTLSVRGGNNYIKSFSYYVGDNEKMKFEQILKSCLVYSLSGAPPFITIGNKLRFLADAIRYEKLNEIIGILNSLKSACRTCRRHTPGHFDYAQCVADFLSGNSDDNNHSEVSGDNAEVSEDDNKNKKKKGRDGKAKSENSKLEIEDTRDYSYIKHNIMHLFLGMDIDLQSIKGKSQQEALREQSKSGNKYFATKLKRARELVLKGDSKNNVSSIKSMVDSMNDEVKTKYEILCDLLGMDTNGGLVSAHPISRFFGIMDNPGKNEPGKNEQCNSWESQVTNFFKDNKAKWKNSNNNNDNIKVFNDWFFKLESAFRDLRREMIGGNNRGE